MQELAVGMVIEDMWRIRAVVTAIDLSTDMAYVDIIEGRGPHNGNEKNIEVPLYRIQDGVESGRWKILSRFHHTCVMKAILS